MINKIISNYKSAKNIDDTLSASDIKFLFEKIFIWLKNDDNLKNNGIIILERLESAIEVAFLDIEDIINERAQNGLLVDVDLGLDIFDRDYNPPTKIDIIWDFAKKAAEGFGNADYRENIAPVFKGLNRYLDETGDFFALASLPSYITLAGLLKLVRAVDSNNNEQAQLMLTHIYSYFKNDDIFLVALGGYSGCGKSTLAANLSTEEPFYGSIIIRSDAVRKFLWGCDLYDKLPSEAYEISVTEKTIIEMHRRTRMALAAGFNVIIESLHFKEEDREAIEKIAEVFDASFIGLWLYVSIDITKKRVSERKGDISDAGISVVELQQNYDSGRIGWKKLDADKSKKAVLLEALKYIN